MSEEEMMSASADDAMGAPPSYSGDMNEEDDPMSGAERPQSFMSEGISDVNPNDSASQHGDRESVRQSGSAVGSNVSGGAAPAAPATKTAPASGKTKPPMKATSKAAAGGGEKKKAVVNGSTAKADGKTKPKAKAGTAGAEKTKADGTKLKKTASATSDVKIKKTASSTSQKTTSGGTLQKKNSVTSTGSAAKESVITAKKDKTPSPALQEGGNTTTSEQEDGSNYVRNKKSTSAPQEDARDIFTPDPPQDLVDIFGPLANYVASSRKCKDKNRRWVELNEDYFRPKLMKDAEIVTDENGEQYETEPVYGFSIMMNRDQCAFITGKNGRTKVKVAKVSGCDVHVDEKSYEITVSSSSERSLRRAAVYISCLVQQKEGSVVVTQELGENHEKDKDLTVMDVPQDAVGFVTGKNGNFLRSIEDEWDVLLFFADTPKGDSREYERLAIFGSKAMRRGAELKVVSTIEAKVPGYFRDHEDLILDRDFDPENPDWKTDVLKFKDDELSFALGKRGATRRKLELASDCIVQYVGDLALFAGSEKQRSRIRTYIKWLFAQLDGPVQVPDWMERDDCTAIDVPQETVGYVTGARRQTMSQIETEYGVMMFFMGKRSTSNAVEKLCIFGPPRNRKGAELRVMWGVEQKCSGYYSNNMVENQHDWETDAFATDVMKLKPGDIGYVLGKSGVTRHKLSIASGVHLQYIGHYACIAGDLLQRKNCRDYIGWLLEQREGKIEVDCDQRDDCIGVDVPIEYVGWVTGKSGNELRKIEELTRTFCFLATHTESGKERVLICGTEEGYAAGAFGGGVETKYSKDAARFTDEFGSMEGAKYGDYGLGRAGAAKMIQDLIEEREMKDKYEGKGGGHKGSHGDYEKGSGHKGYGGYGESGSKGHYGGSESKGKGSYKGSGKDKGYGKSGSKGYPNSYDSTYGGSSYHDSYETPSRYGVGGAYSSEYPSSGKGDSYYSKGGKSGGTPKGSSYSSSTTKGGSYGTPKGGSSYDDDRHYNSRRDDYAHPSRRDDYAAKDDYYRRDDYYAAPRGGYRRDSRARERDDRRDDYGRRDDYARRDDYSRRDDYPPRREERRDDYPPRREERRDDYPPRREERRDDYSRRERDDRRERPEGGSKGYGKGDYGQTPVSRFAEPAGPPAGGARRNSRARR